MFKQSMYNYRFSKHSMVYYYNSLSGQLIRVDKETDNYLANIHINESPEKGQYFNELKSKGFIVYSNLNEYERIYDLKNELLYSSNNETASYVIALTTDCNYKCIYCFEDGCHKGVMTIETATKVVDFIKKQSLDNRLLKRIHIAWFGGEPLLNLKCIIEIGNAIKDFSYHNKYSFATSLITNGFLLNDETLDLLMKYDLDNVQITLDGDEYYYNEYKKPLVIDAFDSVVDNIIKTSNKCKTVIRMNCSKENYESIKFVCKDLLSREDINKDNISFTLSRIVMKGLEIPLEAFSDYRLDFYDFLSSIGRKDLLVHFMPMPSTIPCGLMQKRNYVIDNEGLIYKCEHYVGKPKYSIGDVEQGVVFPEIYRSFINTPFLHECEQCFIFPICRGGCSQKRFVGEDSVSCEKKKEEIQKLLELLSDNE